MSGQRPRQLVVIGLLVLGVGAGGALLYSLSRERALSRTEAAGAAQLDDLVGRVALFDATLRTYGATREAESVWFTRTTVILEELSARARALDSTLTGVAMMPRARLAESLQVATEAVDRARANFESNRTLMALDALESNARPAAEALAAELAVLRRSTTDELAAARDGWRNRASAALALWALAWAIGLAWLARRTPVATAASQPPTLEPVAEPAAASPAPLSMTFAGGPAASTPDLTAVADVCEAIAHLTTAEELPRVLARTTRALGASGVVLWVRDSDALVVGAAHGYPDGLAERLGRVKLTDENLLTRAWHTGQPQSASTTTPGRQAALVAPIVGSAHLIGVLAAEVPAGVESDPLATASARLIAAQLSGVLSAGSEAAPDAQGSRPDGEPEADTPAASPPLEAAG